MQKAVLGSLHAGLVRGNRMTAIDGLLLMITGGCFALSMYISSQAKKSQDEQKSNKIAMWFFLAAIAAGAMAGLRPDYGP